jgi:tripartite-type tricarboxylate transporter receptor subunit TctC
VVWIGVLAPTGTPPNIVQKLNAEVNRILVTPSVQTQLVTMGVDPLGGSPEDFKRTLVKDIPRWKQMVIDAGLNIQ